jgi:hypothetical protein
LGGCKYLFLNQINKKRSEIVDKLQLNMNQLLNSSSSLIKSNKKDFVLDMVGLYRLETRMKSADKHFRMIFFGFAGFSVLSLIFVIVYPLVGIFVMIPIGLLGELCLLLCVDGFNSIYDTVKSIEKYEAGVPPREFTKNLRI